MRLALAVLALLALRPQESPKERLRRALGDTDLAGTWIYDDLDAATAEAGRTGKPLMVVLRCVT